MTSSIKPDPKRLNLFASSGFRSTLGFRWVTVEAGAVVVLSKSPQETIRIGKRIGRLLVAGDVVALVGDLGAGKTQFIKGLALGVGVKSERYVSSPSFTIIHEYPARIPFYHIDLFRLKSEEEAQGLGLEEYFGGNGITAVEWAERAPSLLPEALLLVNIQYVDEHTRSIELVPKGRRYEERVRKMSEPGLQTIDAPLP